jgi:hypothetical protein
MVQSPMALKAGPQIIVNTEKSHQVAPDDLNIDLLTQQNGAFNSESKLLRRGSRGGGRISRSQELSGSDTREAAMPSVGSTDTDIHAAYTETGPEGIQNASRRGRPIQFLMRKQTSFSSGELLSSTRSRPPREKQDGECSFHLSNIRKGLGAMPRPKALYSTSPTHKNKWIFTAGGLSRLLAL